MHLIYPKERIHKRDPVITRLNMLFIPMMPIKAELTVRILSNAQQC